MDALVLGMPLMTECRCWRGHLASRLAMRCGPRNGLADANSLLVHAIREASSPIPRSKGPFPLWALPRLVPKGEKRLDSSQKGCLGIAQDVGTDVRCVRRWFRLDQ
jgi:hypothetical protein